MHHHDLPTTGRSADVSLNAFTTLYLCIYEVYLRSSMLALHFVAMFCILSKIIITKQNSENHFATTTVTITLYMCVLFFLLSRFLCRWGVYFAHFISVFVIWLIYFFEVKVFCFVLSKWKQNSCIHVYGLWSMLDGIRVALLNSRQWRRQRRRLRLRRWLASNNQLCAYVYVCRTGQQFNLSAILGMFYLMYRHEHAFHLVLIAFFFFFFKIKQPQQ